MLHTDRARRTPHQRQRRGVAAVAVLALVAASCGSGDEAADGDPEGVATDVGVTDEPCPDAVNADNGCIYLGVLSDITEGPFAPLGAANLEGLQAFWNRVNEDGGVAGAYDVDIDTYTRDTLYDPQTHASEYRAIEPDILALAQSFGTPPTEAILPDMDVDDVVAAPAGWWSGLHFDDQDQGLILESGYSYCLEGQIGMDYVAEEVTDVGSVLSVGFPGDYGGDFAVGIEAWAQANDVDHAGAISTLPNAAVGTQDEAIGQILSAGADVVALAVGPSEMGEIVGQTVAQGFEGRFIGSAPAWNPALLQSPAAPALLERYLHIGPWETYDGDTDAHAAMRAQRGDDDPANDGFTAGWMWSYPLLTAIEDAIAAGDLTRAGLREAASSMVVEYEGALPDRDFSIPGNEDAPRVGVIGRPSEEATLGLETVVSGFQSATADAFAYDEACIVP